MKNFKNLWLALAAMDKCGNMPCIVNAANEVAVEAFLKDRVGFCQMTDIIEQSMQKIDYIKHPDLEQLIKTDQETRELTQSFI
jgi:1-deoxy-D-xylulose-5-phosphate reductoisomerase